jgi:hypothetical protein
MSMMELQGALGGPPGGGPPAIDVPGPGGEGAPPAGPEGAPPAGPEGGGDSLQFLDDAEQALAQFIQVDPDEVDRAEASKALQIVLKLKASNQTDSEQGGMKSLRRALTGGPGAPGPGAPGPGGPLA